MLVGSKGKASPTLIVLCTERRDQSTGDKLRVQKNRRCKRVGYSVFDTAGYKATLKNTDLGTPNGKQM